MYEKPAKSRRFQSVEGILRNRPTEEACRRIAEIKCRDISRSETHDLMGQAMASFREQRLPDQRPKG
ncbi:hypothetical protein FGK63_05060 [Ruegeria sediminis]|uniref:Uncharacterized protein n=1 Tax=Ruegeria sediminis TaxID=2583820 RepID=A0ABY2X0Y4_9RHOB|nr:hypothetical protein [Ruegeria sediminis]TMV08503.1 hypothetical protein FGK63_05060 [Ruegeria sediminis]